MADRWTALAAAAALSVVGNAAAQDRKSCVTTGSNDTLPEITLGCVPKERQFTLYVRTEGRDSTSEGAFDVGSFPAGFSSKIEEQGNYSLTIDAIITRPAGQILRGSLSNGQGCQVPGTYFVFSKDWNCSLFVKGKMQ
jgi:hypothetical protein